MHQRDPERPAQPARLERHRDLGVERAGHHPFHHLGAKAPARGRADVGRPAGFGPQDAEGGRPRPLDIDVPGQPDRAPRPRQRPEPLRVAAELVEGEADVLGRLRPHEHDRAVDGDPRAMTLAQVAEMPLGQLLERCAPPVLAGQELVREGKAAQPG